jgi:hypothetical protein
MADTRTGTGAQQLSALQVFDFKPMEGRAERSQLTQSGSAASRSRLKSRSAVAAYKGAMMAIED